MSYAAEVKKELTGRIVSDDSAKSELAALLQMNGVSTWGLSQEIKVQTENPAIARRIYTLIKQLYPAASVDVQVNQRVAMTERKALIVVLQSQVEDILADLGVDPLGINQEVPAWLLNTEEKRRSFLRGAFLAAGSVNSPEKANYHLEIYTSHEGFSEQLTKLMVDFDMPVKVAKRHSGYFVYLKRSEKIVDFLKLIGAGNTMLHFADIRISRDMRNSVNRLNNADMANLQRVAVAANSQVQAILTIQKEIGDLDELPPKLADFARARLEHPDGSLAEIGDVLEISKSGANHRMRKLAALAKTIEEGGDFSLDKI
ncbi:DNA-binding protein WhiA [Fructobacillus ficulneus]|uniref:Probable cell division protein WhiA n=1 Tax=Fructobacillus ficulneus TaxID=157463 RepID=A0A0K8MIQ7_9LACO|nr:DNA-binding protein WhiA [Fructobacillus ficulneus]GAO99764.1 putative sporulation transcription regulator WhiA [Fructobacillus ficulneus]